MTHISDELHLVYDPVEQPRSAASDTEEVELEEDDLDAGWYTGGRLSLADALC